jgi:hypothetical protein
MGNINQQLCFPQVNHVDAVALREDKIPHLRIPPTGKVTKVGTSFEQLLYGYVRHELSKKVVLNDCAVLLVQRTLAKEASRHTPHNPDA